jgi:hypothetical protein
MFLYTLFRKSHFYMIVRNIEGQIVRRIEGQIVRIEGQLVRIEGQIVRIEEQIVRIEEQIVRIEDTVRNMHSGALHLSIDRKISRPPFKGRLLLQ